MKKLGAFLTILCACVVLSNGALAGRGDGNSGNGGGNGAGGQSAGGNGLGTDNLGQNNRVNAMNGVVGEWIGGPGGQAHQTGAAQRSAMVQNFLYAKYGIGSGGGVVTASSSGMGLGTDNLGQNNRVNAMNGVVGEWIGGPGGQAHQTGAAHRGSMVQGFLQAVFGVGSGKQVGPE